MIRPAFISQAQWLINLGRGDVRRNLRKQQQRTKIVYSRDTTQPTVNGVRKLTHPSQSVPRFLRDSGLMSRARLTIIQFVKIKLIPSALLSTLIATHSEHEPTLLARHRNIVVWMTLGGWSNPCLLHVLRLASYCNWVVRVVARHLPCKRWPPTRILGHRTKHPMAQIPFEI